MRHPCEVVRTSLELDDHPLGVVQQRYGLRSKKETVNYALRCLANPTPPPTSGERMTLHLHVPRARLRGFYRLLAAWLEGRPLPEEPSPAPADPSGKAGADDLLLVPVEVEPDRAPQLYAAYADWLGAERDEQEHPELDPAEADHLWRNLHGPQERELLLLLDDVGGTVPWATLRHKLGLPAAPDLRRDLPETTAWCARRGRAFPVHATDGGDPALRLAPHLVGRFTALQRLQDEPGDDRSGAS